LEAAENKLNQFGNNRLSRYSANNCTANKLKMLLAKKVAKITPTFSRLTAQLHSSKISPQSIADTANAAITEIILHAARVVLGKVDPPALKKEAGKSTVQHNTNHWSSQNPQEAHLQRTIQHHRNAIYTLRKDLSLDDRDTLTFHRDKLKQAQGSLDKLRKTKKQENLLSTITQDAAHDVGPADHLHNSMWDYLKKYKNNHTTSSLPQKTRSKSSPDKRIWMTGPATLNPLNWHCFRFALGHHLFQHPLSPYDEKIKQDVAKLLPKMREASTATATTHPVFKTPFTPEELENRIKRLLLDKSPGPSGISNQMLQAGDIDFQGLILILFNGLWEFHAQPSDWQLYLLQTIYKGHNKDNTDPASCRGIYLNDTLAKLFEGLLIARLTTHMELLNTFTDNQL